MEMNNLIRSSARPEPTTSTSFLQRDDRLPLHDALSAIGLPETEKDYSYSHLAAVLMSVVCSVLGSAAITPSLGLAWHLQVTGQIIVIGFLLGVMNICLQTILPFTFLLLEVRFGPSHLQNFEAILLARLTASHVSRPWRIILFCSIVLPLGLSIAYKRFFGGTTSSYITSDPPGSYGIHFSAPGSEYWTNDFLFTSISSLAAYRLDMSSGVMTYPQAKDFPVPYGYNTLVLSNDTASVLDMPTMAYLTRLRSQLSVNETLTINASVDAYQATYNSSTMSLQNDDTLWSDIVYSGSSQRALSTIDLYVEGQSIRLGMMPFDSDLQLLIGIYDQSTIQTGLIQFSPSNTAEFDQFRKQAQIFRIQRARCRGSWTVTNTDISLVKGSCDTSPVDSSVLHIPTMELNPYDVLPVLALLPGKLAEVPGTPWMRATYATSIATMYWARALQILSENNIHITYAPMDEMLTITRNVLRAEALLYFVILIQPALTVLSFAVTIWLHKVMISKNFGIVSILSGLDLSNLAFLQGAELSGKINQPVRLVVVSRPFLRADCSKIYRIEKTKF